LRHRILPRAARCWRCCWQSPGTIGSICYAIGKAWLYGLPLLWLLLVDRQRPSLSLPRKGGMGAGLLLGLVIAAAILATYFLFLKDALDDEKLRQLMVENGLGTPARFIAACLWFALANSLLEEYAFRWFITSRLLALTSFVPAVVLSGLIFTAHHVIVVKAYFPWSITLLASLGVLMGGLAWSWCYAKYQSVWPGYLSHILADVAIYIIGWRLLFGS
jgi:membrane protease YdiL (CAAX protease family)